MNICVSIYALNLSQDYKWKLKRNCQLMETKNFQNSLYYQISITISSNNYFETLNIKLHITSHFIFLQITLSNLRRIWSQCIGNSLLKKVIFYHSINRCLVYSVCPYYSDVIQKVPVKVYTKSFVNK